MRSPWPPFTGRAAEIAGRLVGGIATAEPRRGELAKIVFGAGRVEAQVPPFDRGWVAGETR